jgi:hypothetical protein
VSLRFGSIWSTLSGSVQLERHVDDDLAADHGVAGGTLSEKQGHLVIE